MIQGFFSTKRTILTTFLSLLLLGVGGALSSAAPTPSVISYQGFLTSATGTAQTGTTTVTIRIYDAATGGTLLFEELHPTTPITNGYFTVQIGSVGDVSGGTTATSITDLSFDRSYYVTVELASPFSTGEMTLSGGARSQLGVVPFATVAYGALQVASSTYLPTGKGKLFFNTSSNELNLYNGSSWVPVVVQGTSSSFSGLTVSGQTVLAGATATTLYAAAFSSGLATLFAASNTQPVFVTRDTSSSTTFEIRTGGLASSNNTALGRLAGMSLGASASANTFLGSQSGVNTSSGDSNFFGGFYSGYYNTSGAYNTFLGAESGSNNTTGDENIFLGFYSGYSNTTGSGNVYLGNDAGSSNLSGNNNILIGNEASDNSDGGSNNIGIGYNIEFASTTGSNQLNIGNLIYGVGIDGVNNTLSSGRIGIGTTTPGAKLSIRGSTGVDLFEVASSSGASLFRIDATGRLTFSNASSTVLSSANIYADDAVIANATVTNVNVVSTLSSESLLSTNSTSTNSFISSLLATLANVASLIVGTSTTNPAFESSVYVQATSSKRSLVVASQSGTSTDFSIDWLGKVKAKVLAIGAELYAESTVTSGGALPTGSFSVGRYTYVSNYSDYTLSIVDTINKNSPVVVGSTTLPGAPTSVYVSGNFAYTTNDYDGSLSVIDISSSTAPTVISSLVVGGSPNYVQVAGGYAYVANYSTDVVIVDVSSSTAMQIATSTLTGGDFSLSTFILGNNLYVTSLDGNLSIFDITTPSDPLLLSVASTLLSGGVSAVSGNVSVANNYAYVSSYENNTVTVVDVTDPSAPIVGSAIPTGLNPFALSVSGGYLYTANYGDNTVTVFSLSDPSAPVRMTSLTAGAGPHSAQVVDSYLYVTNSSDNTLSLFNISDIAGPTTTANNVESSNLTVRNNLYLSGLTSGAVPFIGSNGRVSVNAGDFFWDAASRSLGIGTAVPTATLSVKGRVGASAFLVEDVNSVPLFSVAENGKAVFGAPSSVPNATFVVSTITGTDALSVLGSTGDSFATINQSGSLLLSNAAPTFDSAKLVVQGTTTLIGSQGSPTALRVVGGIDNTLMSSSPISLKSRVATGSSPSSVKISGRYAYVANFSSNTLSILDISKPVSPIVVSTTSVGTNPNSVYVSGSYAYVANFGSNTLSILDISDPSSPSVVATHGVGTRPLSVFKSGNYVYVANRDTDSLSIIDVRNPASPITVATAPTGDSPFSVYVSGSYAYVANYLSGSLSIIDISDPASPVTVATPTVGTYPIDVHVSGSYAYVANNFSGSLSIVDISNPASPVTVATPSTGAGPYSVSVSGNYAYVVNYVDGSLSIFDISDPTSPSALSTNTIGSTPVSVYVLGKYAYVAHSGSGSLSLYDLGGFESTFAVIHSLEAGNLSVRNDISTGGVLNVGTALTVGQGGFMSQGNSSVYGSLTVGTSTSNTLFSVDSSRNFVSIGTTTNTFDSSKLVVQGTTTLIGTTGSPTALRVIGNIDNTATSTFVPQVLSSTVLGSVPQATQVVGNYAYFVNTGSSSISVIDISNKRSPEEISFVSLDAAPMNIAISGNYAYVAKNNSTLSVIDISNPKVPVEVATMATLGTTPYFTEIGGNYLYINNFGEHSVSVVDISNPRAPHIVGELSVPTNPEGGYISGKYLYITSSTANALSVIDISSPTSPVLISTLSMDGTPVSVYTSGRYAYVSQINGNNVAVVDISDPSNLIVTGTSTSISGPRYVAVSGRYAYTANSGDGTVSVLDIADPNNPIVISTVSVGGSPFYLTTSERYIYVTDITGGEFSILDLGGLESTSALIHSLEAGNLSVRNDISTGGILNVGTALTVGSGGLMSQGNSAIYGSLQVGTSTYPNFLVNAANNTTNIGTSTGLASLFIQGTSTLNPLIVASSTGITLFSISQSGLVTLTSASTTGAATIGGQLYFASASSTGGLTLAQTLNVTGQTTLTTASATGITSTNIYGTTALLGTTTNTFDSSKLVVQGTTTLVGTTGSPTALRVMGNIDNTFSQGDWPRFITSTTTAVPGDLVVSGGFMYVISSAELSIYNVADIRNPLLISTSSANGNSIKVVGNYAYITGPSFSIVDVTDKRAPVQVGSVSYGSSYGYSAIRGQYAYVSSSVENTLKVIDISNPRQPRVTTSLSVGSSPRDLDISGSTLYLVEHGAGGNLFSIDISNPLNPVLLDTLSVASGLQSVKVSGGYVYVQRFSSGGLYIVDGSNPSDLVQIASVSTGSGSNDIKIDGGYAYVPNYNAHTISIVDVRNPYSPVLVKNISTSNNPSALFVDGKNLYVTNYGLGGVVSFYELPGLESVSALIHSLETGNLSVRNSLTTSGLLSVGAGLTVGSGGFLSQGNSAVYGSLQVGTSTYPHFLVNASNNTTNIGTSTGLATLFVQGTSTLNPFSVASSTGTSLFTILANGNVGIGTTTPGAHFDIKAATTNSLGGLRILSSTNDNVSSRIFDGGDEGFFEQLSGGSVRTLLRANGDSYLNGGNVGIGTSSPQAKLHVYGGNIFGQSAAGTSNLILGNADGSLNGKYSYMGSASGQTAFGRMDDDLVTKIEFLRIDSSGNVGVGTTSMSGSSKFFVEGSINIPQNYALRANNNWLIGQASTTNTISIGSTVVANDIQFNSSAGTDLFTIKSDGNVGVGSTTPFAKLSIGAFAGTGIALTPTDTATVLSSFNDSATGDPEQLRISHNFARVNIDNLRSSLNLQSYGADVVIGTTSTAGSRLDIYHNTPATSTDMFRVISDVGTVGNVIYTIKANGDIFTDGNTTIGTPADLAENYPTSDTTITPGMVVALSSTTLFWSQSLPNGSTTDYEIAEVKKAEIGEQALGVISTRPGILLGGNTEKGIPVAFSGRVPVYVSNENGVVRRGDSLTVSSSTPGYAMKQTTNGQSIGRALSDQPVTSTSSLVMMLVENTNRTITVAGVDGLSLLTSSSSLSNLSVRETLIERLDQGYSVVKEYVAVRVSAVTGYFDTVFAKDIYTDTICIKKADGTNVCFNGDQIEDVLNASNIPLLENTPQISGTTSEEGLTPVDATTVTSSDETSSNDEVLTLPAAGDNSEETEDTPATTEQEVPSESPQPSETTPSVEE